VLNPELRERYLENSERNRKQDVKWKLANIIVRIACEKQYAIVLEKLGKKPAENMIKRIKDDQLRHRIYQASSEESKRQSRKKRENTACQ